MKFSRTIYSDFTIALTDTNYIIRNLWIGIAGFILIITNAYDSDNGFSGEMSLENYVIYFSIATYFILSSFSQDYNFFKKLFLFVVLGNFLFSCGMVINAYNNINYLLLTSVCLAIYSAVTLTIIMFQYETALQI